jgi:uncharacterized protein YndB with AHSA1/START domain
MAGGGSPLDDTVREVGERQIAAGAARMALIRLRYDASIEDVWAACTEPDRLNRWFLQLSGDLWEGGRFALAGNASGEILRCEPPRMLAVTWEYGDRPADEVELRLSPSEDGGTLLELEHATVTTLVEWEGRQVDVLSDVGAGWELPLAKYLPRYLRGELPDAPSAEWYEPNAQDAELASRSSAAWTALTET